MSLEECVTAPGESFWIPEVSLCLQDRRWLFGWCLAKSAAVAFAAVKEEAVLFILSWKHVAGCGPTFWKVNGDVCDGASDQFGSLSPKASESVEATTFLFESVCHEAVCGGVGLSVVLRSVGRVAPWVPWWVSGGVEGGSRARALCPWVCQELRKVLMCASSVVSWRGADGGLLMALP